ncbi:MAG: hypothetical protein GX225_05110 [Clostridiales bacterium]|nr:hypothetical protein [Clostridiales bacterium]
MAEEVSLLYPPGYDGYDRDGFTNFDFVSNLGIDGLIFLRRESFLGVPNLELKTFFTKNPEVLAYRIDVVDDIFQNRGIYDVFCKTVPMIQNICDMRRVNNQSDMTTESNLFSIKILEMYIEIIDALGEELLKYEVKSQGLKGFQDIVRSRYESEEFKNLKSELTKMETRIGNIKSITLGINMNGSLQVREAGLVSINTKEYRNGNIVEKLLGKSDKDGYACLTDLSNVLKIMDKHEHLAFQNTINYALNQVFRKTVRNFEPLINKYFSGSTDFLVSVLNDLRFLNAGMKFIFEMSDRGLPMCKPEIATVSDKKCTFKDGFNPMVAIKVPGAEIVKNDFEFDDNGRFYIITGPNHGGKSVFLYTVGMIQSLFQLGLYVPATSAVISPVGGIFTHFPSSDENNYGKGRLEFECDKLSNVLDMVDADSMILLDEAFASTSGTEASYIASEVITALGIIGLRGLFVTHIHDLPMKIEEFNSHIDNKSKIDNLVAQMESKENGSRSYKLKRTTPDGLSYARDIAKKYGLELDKIINRNS